MANIKLKTAKSVRIDNQKGFTLIEIIAILVILGLIAAIALPRFVDLENNAKQKTVDTLKAEINGREALTWANHKISASGYVSDAKIFGDLNLDFEPNYRWNPGNPTLTGGTLKFKGDFFTFSRTASTHLNSAVWTQK